MPTKKEVHTVIDFRSMKIFSTPSLGYSVIQALWRSLHSYLLTPEHSPISLGSLPPNYVTILKSAGSCIPKGTEGQMQQQQCGAFLLILISVFMRKCRFKFFF